MSTPTEKTSPSGGGRGRWILIGGLVVVAAVVVGGVLWWLSGDAPEEASIEGALGAISTQQTTTSAAGSASTTTTAGAQEGLDGTWTVDTSIGEFSFEEATASFVGFRIKEELSTIGETEAVGRTPDVTGTLEIQGTTITDVSVEANMNAIITNDSRRDSRARSALKTGDFPTGAFALSAPIELGELPAEGETITTTAVGELTIAGVTNPVEFELEAQLVDGLIVVVGNTSIVFADYDVSVPSAPIILSVEDNGIVELQLWFSPS
jgi:polyisoprenoid-binding protein YceI